MLIKMQQRRGLASEWTAVANSVVLSSGEFGLETDTGKFKIGDGSSLWSELSYVLDDSFNAAVYAKLSGTQSISGSTTLAASAANTIPLLVDGATSQSAKLQSWRVAGVELGSVSSSGLLTVPNAVVSGTVTINGAVVDNNHAVTKAYVDANTTGLDIKESVRVATTGNITLSGTQTIDGVSVIAGDRVLVKDQTAASENGIYVVSASGWSRSADVNSSAEVTRGLFAFAEEGTQNSNTGWTLITLPPYTLDTTPLVFTLFSSGVRGISAGNGLTNTGNVFNIAGTTDRISVSADAIDISANYAGQSTISTLGTVSTGTWNAGTIPVAHGGTGATTAEAARTSLSAAAASHTHTAANITDPLSLDVGKINGKKISVQSSAPSSPSDGDLWFY
jgi:hypothetical protein